MILTWRYICIAGEVCSTQDILIILPSPNTITVYREVGMVNIAGIWKPTHLGSHRMKKNCFKCIIKFCGFLNNYHNYSSLFNNWSSFKHQSVYHSSYYSMKMNRLFYQQLLRMKLTHDRQYTIFLHKQGKHLNKDYFYENKIKHIYSGPSQLQPEPS